jgi:hypothetical protein
MYGMKCAERLNRYYGDFERCKKNAVACINTALLPLELCKECAEIRERNGEPVHYYTQEAQG